MSPLILLNVINSSVGYGFNVVWKKDKKKYKNSLYLPWLPEKQTNLKWSVLTSL